MSGRPSASTAAPESRIQIGQLIGNYQVIRLIGHGGMGAVFEAKHQYIDRRAAIKVLHPSVSQNPLFSHRFLNEARALNAIKHPGLVEIFEFGLLPDGTAYLIMEFLEGEPLGALIKRGATKVHTFSICRQIALALAAAHEKGIIHRDLKPDNLMVIGSVQAPQGLRIKVLDFGIAKLTEQNSDRPQTEDGQAIGTPMYMAPEQCIGAATVDGKADVYSLGMILYEMLAGRLPFDAKVSFMVMSAHVHEEPHPLHSLVPTLPQEVVDLVHSLIAKDPGERPSMETVALILEEMPVGALAALSAQDPLSSDTFGQDATIPSGAGVIPPIVPSPGAVPRRPSGAMSILSQSDAMRQNPLSQLLPRVNSTPLPRTSTGELLPAVSDATNPALMPFYRRPDGLRLLLEGILLVAVGWLAATVYRPAPQAVPAAPTAELGSAQRRTVKWVVNSTPPGAEVVRADGKVVGSTPWQMERPAAAGETSVTLRLPNYQDKSIVLDLNADLRTEVLLLAASSSKAPAEELPDAASEELKKKSHRRHKK